MRMSPEEIAVLKAAEDALAASPRAPFNADAPNVPARRGMVSTIHTILGYRHPATFLIEIPRGTTETFPTPFIIYESHDIPRKDRRRAARTGKPEVDEPSARKPLSAREKQSRRARSRMARSARKANRS